MMIRLTTLNGTVSRHEPHDIVAIAEPTASSGWHGVKAIVRLSNGERLEVIETPDEIEAAKSRAMAEQRAGQDYQTKG